MSDKATINKVARAICRERCAFMGEPACHEVDGKWPPAGCDDPGCMALAMAALAAAIRALATSSEKPSQSGE